MYGLVNELSQQPYCASSQVEAIKWMRWAGRRLRKGMGMAEPLRTGISHFKVETALKNVYFIVCQLHYNQTIILQ